jgi:two-component system cell cycle sensor histidine kinase/response regulator CckA
VLAVMSCHRGNTWQDEEREGIDSIVIMDLTIPGGMGGKEAARELLAFDPQAKIVVSSGYSNDPVMASYREHGFVAVINKPFKLEDLADLLHRVQGSTVQGSGPEV